MPALDQYLSGKKDRNTDLGKPKQRAFKVKRAEQRHRATLMELAQSKPDQKQ